MCMWAGLARVPVAAEGTALRMLCSATGAKFKNQWGIVAATGCKHRLYIDLPLQPIPSPLDQLAVRERARRCTGCATPLGISVAGETSRFGVSVAMVQCLT